MVEDGKSRSPELLRFQDQVVIVTGGGSGIGQAVALGFAREGAMVILVGRTEEKLKATQAMIAENGGQAELRVADVSRKKQTEKVARSVAERHGHIDILINCAGVLQQTPFEEISEEEYDRILDTNLKGTFFFCQNVMEYLLQSKGVIVNISSVAGQRGGTKAPHYAASKAGIINLTRSLSSLYAPLGVRVNAIAPGQIETEMTKEVFQTKYYQENVIPSIPLGRVGRVEEVANVALFLASDMSSYITGQVINVNGGEY